ncbi:hypothetical protein [Bradyrhizobium sp. Ce-3]|uniref:hypothetical protein n=1 Tax=Bradyrhizobium sp. Ce-3 TaxID=2913970 RepID=UPI001FC81CCE|nr:hypothetical protein [Bradyrhizobium sp. Ce-3]GKQ52620.1 hypothetical protein BRSPCE3_34750 [Bradyrhizobium sp. Ce-3]
MGPPQHLADGSVINGLTSFTRSDGTAGVAADTSLAYAAATLAGGISSQFNQLIQAMATYSAGGAASEQITTAAAQPGEHTAPIIAPSWH